MKKVSKKLLVGSLLTLVFMGSVSAKSLSEGNSYTKNWDKNLATTVTDSGDHYISISDLGITNMPGSLHADTYKLIPYYIYDTEDTMTAYCADPHLASTNNYQVERILGTSDNETVKKVDLGILEILKNGHHSYKNESESDKSEYMATSIALRAFLIVVGGNSRIKVGSVSDESFLAILSAHANIGLEWADNQGYINGITTPSWSKDKYVFGKANSVSTGGSSSSGTEKNEGSSNYEYIYVCSKDYCPSYNGNRNGCLNIKGCGYKQGTGYSTSDSTTGNCSGNSGDYSINGNKCIRKGTNKCEDGWKQDGVEAVKTATSTSQSIKATQLSTVAYGKSNSTSSVLTRAKELFILGYEAYKNGGSTPSITTTESKSEGKVTITFNYSNFTANKGKIVIGNLSCSGGTCGSVSVSGDVNNGVVTKANGTIKATFSIPSGDNCSNISYTLSYKYDDPNLTFIGAYLIDKNTTNTQSLYAIQDKSDSKNNDGVDADVTGRVTCGDACETEIEEPICSSSESDAVATIKTNTDIKKCILDNQDDAGNTYQFESYVGGVDNDYCQVYCKEDYDRIELNPVVPDVKCGTYFKLTSNVEGKKTCYTSGKTSTKQIDKEKYEKDINQAIKEMIDAWNIYSYYKAAADISFTHTSDYGEHSAHDRCCARNDKGECTKTCHCNGTSKTVDIVTKDWTFDYYSFTGVKYTNQTKYTSLDGVVYESKYKSGVEVSCWHNSCSGENGKEVDHAALRNSAKETLNDAIEKYERIISDYNACTTGWKNEFAFKQQLEYYYDEMEGDGNTYTPYYDLLSQSSNSNASYLEKDGDETSSATITICKGNTTNSYECLSGEQPVDVSADSNSLGTYNYNSAYSNVFTLKNYIKCSESGCAVDKESYVSEALFVKKEVEKKQKYITPTAFYQIAASGKITVVSPDEYTGTKVQLEALENALPISTSSVGGGVFKLMITNLGEFYDREDTYGRLIDYGGIMENYSVIKAIGSTTFDGNYVCHYENPCRPNNCPNCDFICDGDGCEWSYPNSCPECNIECVGCIFNLGELSISHKTISTSNFSSISAGRKMGYNWITTTDLNGMSDSLQKQLSILASKATLTIQEIEQKNETIYDTTDKNSDSSELAFSIKLTPDVISTIKEYNKAHEKDGGYINDSLTCYDATINGVTYENIYCYSDLIDDLMAKYDNVIEVNNRLENNDTKRKNETGSSGYWTLWNGYVYSENVLGGPSWK